MASKAVEKEKRISYIMAGSPVMHYSKYAADIEQVVRGVLTAAGKEDLTGDALIFLEMLYSDPHTSSRLGEGWVNINSKLLKKRFGNHYKQMTDLLEDEGVVEVYRGARLDDANEGNLKALFGLDIQHTAEPVPKARAKYAKGKYPIAYRMAPGHLPEDVNNPAYLAKKKHTFETSFRIWNEQNDVLRGILLESTRQKLSESTQRICANLDKEQAWKDVNIIYARDSKASFGKDEKFPIVQLFRMVDRLRDPTYYFEKSRDEFGNRFHSPLTSSVKLLSEYIRIDGKPAMELDFRNSQYYFLALAIKYGGVVMNILTERDGDDRAEVAAMLTELTEAFNKHQDVREFCSQALAGNLYNWLTRELNRKGCLWDMDTTKENLMPGIMSDESECILYKRQLSKVIPNVVEVCGRLNKPTEADLVSWREFAEANGEGWDYETKMKMKERFYLKTNLIPKLMQRLESRVILDRIAVEAFGVLQYPFTTVHDSFKLSVEDEHQLKSVISQWFFSLGIEEQDHPKVKQKVHKGWNCGCGQKECGCAYWTTEELGRVPSMYLR